jgi:hypothetical protein
MRGVDVVDQMREYYTIQLQSHKWWHKVFLFILDSTLDNSFVLYSEDQREMGLPVLAIAFRRMNLAKALVLPFVRADIVRGGVRNFSRRSLHRVEGHLHNRVYCIMCGTRT